MAFPQDPLPIKQELLIDGTWTDVTTRTRLEGEVRITRGQNSDVAGGTLAVGNCVWTCNNRDFFFSNRVPASANYGKIGKNTQYRTSVTRPSAFLRLADYSDAAGAYDGASASTTDKSVLDITGDIDVRVDIEPDDWFGGRSRILLAKYNPTGDQRSWLLWVDRLGYPRLRWSTDGTTANAVNATATEAVPGAGRLAIRAVLDVNNGAGGHTTTFYTSDTISGSWTQLGDPVTDTGTTSIFSSSAPVTVGTVAAGSGVSGRMAFGVAPYYIDPFVGKFHRAQVRNSAGTLVADFNPAGQAAGTTSWSDGLSTPNTWTLAASAEVTAQDFRFWGELGTAPSEWDVSGVDVFGQFTCYDLPSRLTQGSKSLHSSIYRNLIRFSRPGETNGTLDGYWPMENGSQATRPTPVIGRYGSMTDAVFTTDEDIPGTEGVLSFSADTGSASGGAVLGTGTGTVTLLLYFRAPSVPAGTVELVNFYLAGGNSSRVAISVGSATYTLAVYDSLDNSLLSTVIGHGTGGEPDQPLAMRVQLVQNGGNVDYAIGWYGVGGPVLFGGSGSYAGTIGRPKSWISRPFTGKSGWWIAHVAMLREAIDWSGSRFASATSAYVGERADVRFARLCTEEGIPWWIVGYPYSGGDFDIGSGSEPMGPQRPAPFPSLIQECAKLDGGQVYGPRDKFGLTFRLRNSYFGQQPLGLDYAAGHLSPGFKPRDDLFFVRNDVTVTNSTGGASRAVKTSGSLNVSEPSDDPQGVGTYDPGPISREAATDERLTPLAEEEVFLGTWDEQRYPGVPVELARSVFASDEELTTQATGVDIGKTIRITNLPPQLPPGPVELLVIGYTETLRNRGRPISWNTSPYGPYRAANNLTGSALFRARAAATPGNSTLTADIDDNDTSFQVATATGKLWRTGSSAPTFPMEITIGGEEMSVGAISGSSSPQTFSSVTRSVNGQVLSHSAGSEVQVRDVFHVQR